MNSWQGGDCPTCGENVPKLMIRCHVCRELLNPDLEERHVQVPDYIPLQEIEPDAQPSDTRLDVAAS